jgi:shikimate kinase
VTFVLIGPPAAGKSSVGRELATLLHTGFLDTDAAIVRAHGPIPEIFATQGEAGFRALERDAVEAALRSGGVVSLGGGAVTDGQTADRLRDHTVILLTVDADAAARRIRGGGRPLVSDVSSWRELVEARMPLYRGLADHAIDTSSKTVTVVARELARWITDAAGAAQEAEA